MITGIIGMIILVSAYLLVITGRIGPKSTLNLSLNITASILLGIYAYAISSWPFLAINTVWITGSLYQMVRNKNHH